MSPSGNADQSCTNDKSWATMTNDLRFIHSMSVHIHGLFAFRLAGFHARCFTWRFFCSRAHSYIYILYIAWKKREWFATGNGTDTVYQCIPSWAGHSSYFHHYDYFHSCEMRQPGYPLSDHNANIDNQLLCLRIMALPVWWPTTTAIIIIIAIEIIIIIICKLHWQQQQQNKQ